MPWLANGREGSVACGVGIRKLPSSNLKFSNARAIGLMLEPSDLTATPPKAPFIPPKSCPSAVDDLSPVKGGELKLDVQAILDCPAATPFTCRVPWYEPKKKSLSFWIGPPRENPNWFCLRFARGWPMRFRKKSLAFRTSLRRNSKIVP